MSAEIPASAPPPRGVFGITSLAIVVLLAIVHLMVRLLSPILSFSYEMTDPGTLAMVLGVAGLLSSIPILAAIVLGHLGVSRARRTEGRGAGIAGAALGGAYLLLLLWGNRLIVAGIAAAGTGDWGEFVPNFFWWA